MTATERHVEQRPVSLTVATRRHGTRTIEGTLVAVNEFTYWIELPQIPDAGRASESAREAIEFTIDALAEILDARSAAYWRRHGVFSS